MKRHALEIAIFKVFALFKANQTGPGNEKIDFYKAKADHLGQLRRQMEKVESLTFQQFAQAKLPEVAWEEEALAPSSISDYLKKMDLSKAEQKTCMETYWKSGSELAISQANGFMLLAQTNKADAEEAMAAVETC